MVKSSIIDLWLGPKYGSVKAGPSPSKKKIFASMIALQK